MTEVRLQGRVAGSGGWSVPVDGRRHSVPVRQARGLEARVPGGFRYLPGWLLLEFPTALLLAVFVGTGWVGYAQHGRPTTDAPIPAVVVPVPDDAASDHPGMR